MQNWDDLETTHYTSRRDRSSQRLFDMIRETRCLFEIRAILEQSLILEIDQNLKHPRLGRVYEKASIHHMYFVLNGSWFGRRDSKAA